MLWVNVAQVFCHLIKKLFSFFFNVKKKKEKRKEKREKKKRTFTIRPTMVLLKADSFLCIL